MDIVVDWCCLFVYVLFFCVFSGFVVVDWWVVLVWWCCFVDVWLWFFVCVFCVVFSWLVV